MAKNIVVCSDGTGNTAIKGRGTNVFKIFEAIDLTGHRVDPRLTPQIALYDDGIGTEDLKPLKIFAGMTGYGLSRNVKQLYKELVRLYDPGDQIFMFGFSRGAFTVRTLAGFVATCGILDAARLGTARELDAAVAKAYRVYRGCYRTKLAQFFVGKPDKRQSAAFKREWCLDFDVRIRFIGVWDTVDAVGLPFHLSDVLNTFIYRFKFPDHLLSPIVDHACHALAIDDERHTFHPLLWDEKHEKEGRIEQVWFSGVHSNVGGGYPKQGMSLVALDWMITAAEDAGLRFVEGDRKLCRDHTNVDDKLYDSRAGLGVFYRWNPRDIEEMCGHNGVAPKLHVSVFERIAHGTEDYAPGNLPPKPGLAITPPARAAERALLDRRTRNLEAVLRAAQTDHGSPLSRQRWPVRAGRASYYVFLITCSILLVAASGSDDFRALLSPGVLIENLGLLILGLATNTIETAPGIVQRLIGIPMLVACVGGGFAGAYLLSAFASRRLSAVFSQAWHPVQPKLREALKDARRSLERAMAPKES